MSIAKFFKDIADFHERFEIDYDGPMRPLTEDLADFRMRCSIEESEEIYGANTSLNQATNGEDTILALAELLDGFVDQLYFNVGTLYLHGFTPDQFDRAWDIVHSKNMKKVKAKADGSDSKRNHGSDVIKPEGWTPPDLTPLVGG